MAKNGRSRIDLFLEYLTDHVYLIALLGCGLVFAIFAAATHYLRPAPPKSFEFSGGAPGGAYHRFAEEYKRRLARHGVEMVIKPSSGAVENLARLRDAGSGVSAGFVQGGIAFAPVKDDGEPDEEATLRSLGSMYYEPLWIFYRGAADIERLDTLRGKRIAIGPEGSGTRKVALDMLALSAIDAGNASLVPLGAADAAKALQADEVDVVFMVAGASAESVQTLLRAPTVKLMSLTQANGYVRRLPYLSTVSLAQGVIDFPANVPARETTMLATTAKLFVREDMHPALVYLLLDVANTVHRAHGLFNDKDAFPNTTRQDVPVADEAERYYKSGKPFLQRYLPYWLANLVDRVWVLLVPALAIGVPLVKLFPTVYGLRVNMRVSQWYRQLADLERELGESPSRERIVELVGELDGIERRIHTSGISDMFAQELYSLRATIDLVRERLGAPHAKAVPVLRGA